MLPEHAGKILVIDDSERTRYVFRRILSRAGYSIAEAETGTEGLVKALEQPDVIIADVNLPDMLGYDLSRRLKANPATASIPVLQISASFTSDESKVAALQGGADSYLVQPVEPPVLLAQVQALKRMRIAEVQSGIAARRWQATFDSLDDGLIVVDPEGRIVRANRSFLSMLALAVSEAEGLPVGTVFESRFSTSFDEVLKRSGDSQQPIELTWKNCWFRVRCQQISEEPERPGGYILLLNEATEYKKMQETLKMSERLAATGRLAHTIAHEINNPLEAMANLLYLVQASTSLDMQAREYLDQAELELERVSQITREMLAYHRDSKRPVAAAPHGVVTGVIAMFRARMLTNRVQWETRLTATRSVLIHPGEMRQALGNIVNNALDAIGPEGGLLRVHCFDSTDMRTGKQGVRFVFSDSGSGIPEDVRPRIYDAFYTTKDAGGSGIGLWLSGEIVRKHQGRLRLRTRTSGPHIGTLFDVFLPSAN